MLSENTKIRRRKLTEVNIKVTFVVWLTEFAGSLLAVFTPTVFGHGQNGTATGHTMVLAFYFVLLPFLYLVNDSEIKNAIVEDSLFRAIRGIFKRHSTRVLPRQS